MKLKQIIEQHPGKCISCKFWRADVTTSLDWSSQCLRDWSFDGSDVSACTSPAGIPIHTTGGFSCGYYEQDDIITPVHLEINP